MAAALSISAGAATAQDPQARGPQPVQAVEVTGNMRVPEATIRQLIAINPGDSVTLGHIDDAIHRLWATAQFSDVSVDAVEPDSAAASAGVTLRFVLKEQPIVSDIEIRGLQNMRASVIRDTAGLAAGQPLNPEKIARAKSMTRQLLGEKGFRVTSIQDRTEPIADRPNEVRLIIDVEEGQHVAIADVEFEGNTVFDDDELEGQISTKKEGFFWFRKGEYNEEQVREDLRANLPAFYGSKGYIDFVVTGDSLIVDPQTGKARLLVRVSEGQQYRLADFEVQGARRYPAEELRQYFVNQTGSGVLGGLGIRTTRNNAGDIFDALAFERATRDVEGVYRSDGYLYVEVQPVIERLPADSTGLPAVKVAWTINEGPLATVGTVSIRGNTYTHENIIRNQLLLLPGDVYSEELLLQSYRSIAGTGFFETPLAPPAMSTDPETGEVNIAFDVKEKQTGSVNFGTSLGGYGGLAGFLGYDSPNLFGQAKTGHLRLEFGRYSNNFEASYSDPSIRGSWLSGAVSLFSSTDRFFTFSEGRRKRTGGSLRFGIPVPGDNRTRFSFGYSLSRTHYENFDDDETESLFSLPPGVQSTFSLGLSRSTLDHPLFPTSGSSQTLESEFTGGFLQGDGQFQKYSYAGSWFVPVGAIGSAQAQQKPIRFTLGLTAEGGSIVGDASRFPFDRFWMGGVQFGRPLRGYDETTITPLGYRARCTFGEPGCNIRLEDRLGDAYMRLSSEIAMRFQDNISLSLFYDAGNTWRGASEINPTQLLRGAGIGAMIVTPFGPIGLDYAYGFDKDRPSWQIHFKFGQGY
ncbi:MAG TPA: outer membrane protein assembly factor BamA [Longimicrobiales bacterium]